MSNLLQRFLTALIAGSVAIAAIVSSVYGFMLFCFIVSVAGLWEFMGLTLNNTRYKYVSAGVAVLIWGGILVMSLLGTADIQSHILHVLVVVLPVLALMVLFNETEKQPLQPMGGLVFGWIYCFLPFLLFYFMGFAGETYNYRIPLGILVLTWALDVGAYFAGRFLGKRTLFVRISPKKTWAGSIGGALLCVGIAIILDQMAFSTKNVSFNWIVVGTIIAVVSQLGDLVESMIKRSVSIKDSGTMLPGHGGFLDRFDGLYLSIPVLFFYMYILQAV